MIESHFKCQFTPYTVEWGAEADKRIAEQDAEIERLDNLVSLYMSSIRTQSATIAALREQVARMPVLETVLAKASAMLNKPKFLWTYDDAYELRMAVSNAQNINPPSTAPQDELAQEGCQHLVVSQSNDLSETCLRCGKHFPPPIQEPPHA